VQRFVGWHVKISAAGVLNDRVVEVDSSGSRGTYFDQKAITSSSCSTRLHGIQCSECCRFTAQLRPRLLGDP